MSENKRDNISGEDCKPNSLRQIFQIVKGAILKYLRAPSSNIRVQMCDLLSTVLQEAAWCGPTNREWPEISQTKRETKPNTSCIRISNLWRNTTNGKKMAMLFVSICFEKEYQTCSPTRRNSGYELVYNHHICTTASNLSCKLKERFCKNRDKTRTKVTTKGHQVQWTNQNLERKIWTSAKPKAISSVLIQYNAVRHSTPACSLYNETQGTIYSWPSQYIMTVSCDTYSSLNAFFTHLKSWSLIVIHGTETAMIPSSNIWRKHWLCYGNYQFEFKDWRGMACGVADQTRTQSLFTGNTGQTGSFNDKAVWMEWSARRVMGWGRRKIAKLSFLRPFQWNPAP